MRACLRIMFILMPMNIKLDIYMNNFSNSSENLLFHHGKKNDDVSFHFYVVFFFCTVGIYLLTRDYYQL